MATHALNEERLRPFLWRRRRGATLVALPSIGTMLCEALRVARRLVPMDAAALLLDDPKRRLGQAAPLTLVAALGRQSKHVGQDVTLNADALVRKTYVEGRVRTEQRLGVRRAAFPIRLEQSVCGVLIVERDDGSAISPTERATIELVADYIARAILNAVDILKQNTLALQDDLTGVKSVRGLDPMLLREITKARENGGDVAVLFIDVDRLKPINDVLGHHAGSEALSRLGRAMRETLEERGTLFRFGGDEFVVVCPGMDAAAGVELANNLRRAVLLATPGPLDDGQSLPAISISVGVASLRLIFNEREDAQSIGKRLVRSADQALHRAKRKRDVAIVATREDDPTFGTPSARGKKR